ncbi:CPBP family intramembrane glutamic endopeptidase [Calditrichota bacterium LG25]
MIPSIDIERIHKLDSRLLVIIAIIQPIFSLITNYLFTINFYKPISVWSYYLINPTLQANLIILLIWGFIIFKIGKHNLSSIWLNRKKLINGIIVGIIFWFVIQAFVFLYLLFSENSFHLHQNICKEIGSIIGQLFGNALTEELIFRGIFFLQLYILLKTRFSDRTAFLISIIASQFFFAVSHLPNRILVKHYENLIIDQVKLFIMGILFVIFYIRTKNFVLTVIIHSLLNYPLRIFEANFLYPLVAFTIFLLSIIFWNKIKMKFGEQDK